MDATATTPTSRASSSAASRLISDTIRNGPACRSTCAMTVSRVTLRDDAAQAVAGRARAAAGVGRVGQLAGERGQLGAVDDAARPFVAAHEPRAAPGRPTGAACRR